MKIKFSKMQGTGNDYVYINSFEHSIACPSELSKMVSDRHFGIGSDGLILVAPSVTADVRMIMFNADGSEGKMCGNGIRCVAKYAYEHGITDKKHMEIETASGIKTVDLTVNEQGTVEYVSVNMGKAVLKPEQIPMIAEGESFIAKEISVGGKLYTATCVSMGNPHCVIFTTGIDDMDLEKIGPYFENHSMFPEQVNTEFVEVMDSHNYKMRVFERG